MLKDSKTFLLLDSKTSMLENIKIFLGQQSSAQAILYSQKRKPSYGKDLVD